MTTSCPRCEGNPIRTCPRCMAVCVAAGTSVAGPRSTDPITHAVEAAAEDQDAQRAHERFHSPEGRHERAEQVSRGIRELALHDPTVAACLHLFREGDLSLLEAMMLTVGKLAQEKEALRKELLSFHEKFGGSSRSIFAAEPGSGSTRRVR